MTTDSSVDRFDVVVREGVADGIGYGVSIDGTEIEQRPQDVGAGDVASSLRGEPLEVLRAMDHHAGEGGESSAADDDDIDRLPMRTLESPEVRSRTV